MRRVVGANYRQSSQAELMRLSGGFQPKSQLTRPALPGSSAI